MSMAERTPCPCKKKTCPRHGHCAECRAHHREHSRWPVYCEHAVSNGEDQSKKGTAD